MRDQMSRIYELEKLEADNLTKFVFDDFWIWTSMRLNLWEMISPETMSKGSKNRRSFVSTKFINLLKTLLNLKEYIKVVFMRKSDVMIFTFKLYRRDVIDGFHRDVYFAHLIEYMESKGIKYTVVSEDEDTFHQYKMKERKHVYFRQPFLFLSKLRSKLMNMNKVVPENLIKLAEELQEKHNLPFVNALFKAVRDYISKKRVYNRFVSKASPKFAFMVPSISKEALISICKKRGIRTIEGEHGTFVPILHSYPDNLKSLVLSEKLITQAPDYYLSFGKNTQDELVKTSLIKPENVRAIGNTRIDYFKKRALNENKDESVIKILITSQYTVTDEWIEFLNGVNEYLKSNKISNIRISVKLHFDEVHRFSEWKKAESQYVQIFDRDTEKEKNLYEMITESDFVASVYSTTLTESVSFNHPTLIVKLWGWDFYEELIKKEILLPIETPEEFVKTVIEYKTDEHKMQALKDKMTKFNALVNTPDAIDNYLRFFDEIYKGSQ